MFDFLIGDTAERRFRGLMALGILLFVVAFRLSVASWRVADFETYLALLVRDIGGTTQGGVFGEPLGWMSIRLGYWWTSNHFQAVLFASYVVSLYYLVGVHVLIRRYDAPWQGLLLSFAAFGPLLAFTLIRASPAYLLVAIAAIEVARGRARAVLFCLAAMLFHVSAMLSLAPVVAALLVAKSDGLARFFSRQATIAGLLAVLVIPFLLFRDALLSSLQLLLFSGGGPLGRLGVYFVTVDAAASSSQSGGVLHFVYFILCSAIVAGYLFFVRGRENAAIRTYVLVSFGFFVLLGGTPVAAFRQSVYWIVPMLLTFPWARVAGGLVPSGMLIASSLVVLAASTSGVVTG